ncbi:MAG: hypothetical protein ACFFCV_00920 [Promethearchaeota archaeon]
MKKNKKILIITVILLLINFMGFMPRNLPNKSETNFNLEEENNPSLSAASHKILSHTYDFEDETIGQDPTAPTFANMNEAGGDLIIADLGDEQQKHLLFDKTADGRVSIRDNFSYFGETYIVGEYHLKVYHDASGFGTNLRSANGETILAMVWWNGEIRNDTYGDTLTTYTYNQWYDVVIYFNLSIGWMFDLDGVRYGADYSLPFYNHGIFTANAQDIWITSFVSGGGNGDFRVDDIAFYYESDKLINLLSPVNKTYTKPMDGYYPGTYGFETDKNGGDPEDWYDGGDSSQIIQEFQGHKKVLEMVDPGAGQIGIGDTLESPPDFGTIEYWLAERDASLSIQNQINNLAVGNCFCIRITSDKFEYYNSTWYDVGKTALDNTWYHIRIDFETTEGKYMGLSEWRWQLYIDGESYGPYTFANNKVPDTIAFYSNTGDIAYADAIGYSWDPNYEIGDNSEEGLVISFDTEVLLHTMSYSLDNQLKRAIKGDTIITMPENGLHSMQIFGVDQYEQEYQSNITYFTVDFPIEIITPEAKVYGEPMSGYYPATYGFESDLPGADAKNWTHDVVSTTHSYLVDSYNGHERVYELFDNNGGGNPDTYNSYANQSNGTVELWVLVKISGYPLWVQPYYDAVPILTVRFNTAGYLVAVNNTDSIDLTEFGAINGNQWYHLRIDFECGSGGYMGLAANTFRVYLNGNQSNSDFIMQNPSTYANKIRITTGNSAADPNYYAYFDAVGYSWDPNYNVGENMKEGLLLYYKNSTSLNKTWYSLDNQPFKRIFGNTTLSLPEDGNHFIRVYGNDSLNNQYQSTTRYFSTHHISIVTPEDKAYTTPMSGYYPATYGFESEKDGTLPRDFINLTASGCNLKVISELDGHKKILDLDDPITYGHVSMRNNLSIPQTYGTMEYWVRSTDINRPFQFEFQDSSLSVFAGFQLMDSAWKGLNPSWTIIPALGTPLVNNWHHIRIDFECTGGNYTGLSQYTLRYTVDNTLSASLPFLTNCTHLDTILYWTSISNYNYHIYLDALSFSWDPNYNIGDNLNEGLLLSYENTTNLDWQGYSFDSQPIITILGNTTIPMPSDGSHHIQVFSNDTLGNIYNSDNRYFSVNTGNFFNIITPENKTYESVMHGYYPATFGFERDDLVQFSDSSVPVGWKIGEKGGTVNILSDIDGHNEVLELHDTSSTDMVEVYHNFADQNTGTIELYVRCGDNTTRTKVFIYDGVETKAVYLYFDDNGWIRYYTTAPQDIMTYNMDQWYHLRIEWNCTAGEWHLWIDGNKTNGAGYAFYGAPSAMDTIYFGTTGTDSNFYSYIDAIGYSWDPNYNIGDNEDEGILLDFTKTTDLKWTSYSLNGQSNRTIFGNKVIPFSNYSKQRNKIQLFGMDFREILYKSEIRYFTVSPFIIFTPENKTYTNPMSGYFPATYGFENDENNADPKDWVIQIENPEAEVISELDGHKKVLRLFDNQGGSGNPTRIYNLINNKDNGTIEVWVQQDDLGSDGDRSQITGMGNGNILFGVRMFGGSPAEWHVHHNGSDTPIIGAATPLINTWYHIRIDFEHTTGGYHGLNENEFYVYINGVGYGPYLFGADEQLDEFHLHTYSYGLGYNSYFDAVGYSWDPNYNIGDNLNEGLLLGYENSTNIDSQWYSLDGQINRTIFGNTTFVMPSNGVHKIQVFGNDSIGNNYYSSLRHFTVQYFPINIITPYNITYTNPMSGYYHATYGFENDEEKAFPNGWYQDVAFGGMCEVIDSYYNHRKVVNLTDTVYSEQTQMKINLTNRDNGTIEFYYLIENSSMRTSINLFETDSSDGIYLRVDSGYLTYRTDAYYNISPILSNIWYHISITFNSTIDKFWITVNGTTYGGSSGYDYRNPNTMMKYFSIASSIYHVDYSFYIDAVGFSWDPNYNVGDNINESLLLSYQSNYALDWQGYSLDSQPIITILGNTTIPMPSDGVHTIQVFGNDTWGYMRSSLIRYFTISTAGDIVDPNITINSPLLYDLFGSTEPYFNITVIEPNLDTMWYTLDGGLTIILITEPTGNIDQIEWGKFGNGTVTIRFYANDTAGNVGWEEVLLRKDVLPPEITITTPISNYLFESTAPSFDATILEPNLNTMWYTLDGGVTIIPMIGLIGNIDQTEWDKFGNGTVTIRFYANDTVGNSNWEEVTVRKDVLSPEITINLPGDNQIFTDRAPNFDLDIIEGNLDTIWYTLDGGLINETCTFSGQIDQSYWNALPPGEYTLRFYATDTLGHEGYAEVIIKKTESPAISSYHNIILFLIMMIGTISLIWQLKKKIK